MNTVSMMPAAIAITMATAAAVSDLRTRRIPNLLTFGGAAMAMVFHGILGGTASLAMCLGGWLLGIALFFPFFAMRGLGGGDVKLLGALGAWLGPYAVLYIGFYSTLAGGVFALAVALQTGYLRQALANLKFLGSFWLTVGFRPAEGVTLDRKGTPRIAYAVPMLAGLLVTLWLR
jgi:prepilin peptidase CpaA